MVTMYLQQKKKKTTENQYIHDHIKMVTMYLQKKKTENQYIHDHIKMVTMYLQKKKLKINIFMTISRWSSMSLFTVCNYL